MKRHNALIHHRGEMWPRNEKNIDEIPTSGEGARGIYILFDGSMPVYVGRGKIRDRVVKACKSKRRGQYWDHFSWYGVPLESYEREIEALLLRMFPPHLRMLNRQRGRLPFAEKHDFHDERPDPIRRPHSFGGALPRKG